MTSFFWYILAAIGEIGGCFAFWAWLRLHKSGLWVIPGLPPGCGTQNESRALIWNSRPGVEASVMVPNCGVFTKRFGVPRFA